MNEPLNVAKLMRMKDILSKVQSRQPVTRAKLNEIDRRIDEDILEAFHQRWLQEIFAQRRVLSLASNPF